MPKEFDPPASWEALVARSPDWLSSFPATAGLERWERDALSALEVQQKEANRPALDIDVVTDLFRPLVGPTIGGTELAILTGLALVMWGPEHADAAMDRRKRLAEDAPPFGSFAEVLATALRPQEPTGMGAIRLGEPEPKRRKGDAERIIAKPNPARVGYDYPQAKQSANGSTGGCKGLASVERHADARRGVALSLLGPTEVWMLAAVYIGEVEKWPKSQGGKLGMVVKRKRSEVAVAYRARICTHSAGCEGDNHGPACHSSQATAGDKAVSERIARARERLTTALVNNGLIPEPRSRVEAEKKRTARPKPPPARPKFASDWVADHE